MLKIITVACALFGILCAVSIESWLRRHGGNKELASDVYTATIEKYSEFWIALIAPIFAVLAVVGAFIGFGIGIKPFAAYAAGAIIIFISVYIGTRSFTSSVVSSSSIISDGDIKGGMKASFRGGIVIGLTLASLGVIALSILFFMVKQKQLVNIAAAFALGASIVGVGIRLSGSILTAAHKLSREREQGVDYVGAYASNGAEFILLILVSACSSALLAKMGVESSGVTSTFTVSSTTMYPIIVLACGVVASVIGILVYRPFTGKFGHFGITAGSITAGVLSFGASLYFSISILESPVYAFCVVIGIIAQLLIGEFCKFFSMDAQIFKRNLPKTSDEDIDIPMIHGLSLGMISSLLPGIVLMSALFFSYKIANYYGIALAAIGANSLAGVNLAVRNYATSLSASASFARQNDSLAEENTAYYNVLNRISANAKASGRAYAAVAEAFTLTALLTAFTFTTGNSDVVLSDPIVFGGMFFGTVFTLVLLGLLISSILRSTNSMLESGMDNPDEYRNVTSLKGPVIIEALVMVMPLVIGFVFGINCVTGFVGAAIVTGSVLAMAFNNTGRYYDRIATDALGSIIILATVIALAAIPAFMKFGGAFF
ncbi:MAG: sodium/proton-translocating pyrophosphatase [Mogibacterium sp.]|nr:sodium/proton-translocating pyrophosphatase [Mogibacterium sp.]